MPPSAEDFLGKPTAEDFLSSSQPDISLSKGADLSMTTLEHMGSEFSAGAEKIGSGIAGIAREFPVGPKADPHIGETVEGLIQFLSAPFTAGGRLLGKTTQDVTRPVVGTETSAGLGATAEAAGQLFSPQILSKGTEVLKMLSGGIKSLLPSVTAKAAKLAELNAAVEKASQAAQVAREAAMGPVGSVKLMQADLPKARQAIQDAKSLLDRTIRETGMQKEGQVALMQDQIKVLEKQFAGENEAVIAKIKQAQNELATAKAAGGSTPLAATAPLPGTTELKVTAKGMGSELGKLEETGQFFKGSLKEASNTAYMPLKKGYEDIIKKAGDVQHDISPITAAKDSLLEQAGFTRKALPTKAETTAAKLPGTATGPTEIPDLKAQGDEVYRRTAAYLEAHAAEFGPGMGRSTSIPVEVYKDLGLPTAGPGATVGQIQAGRSEVRAAQRALEDNGHWKAARQMDKLEQAYTASLQKALPVEEFKKLGQMDAEYAKFIETYGFGSPASKIGELPSENMIAKIFPEGKPTGYLNTPNMVLKALPNQAIRDRLAGTFLRQNIMAGAIDEVGNLDMAIVKANLTKHDPEQLKLAFGQRGFENIQGIIQKYNKAKALNAEQIANFENAATVRTGIAERNVGKLEEALTTQKQEQASVLGLQKENLSTQAQSLTDQLARVKEESVLGVQGAKEQQTTMMGQISTAREAAKEATAAIKPAEKAAQEAQAMLDEFNKPRGSILSRAGNILLHKAEWHGAYGIVRGLGHGGAGGLAATGHIMEGVGLLLTAESVAYLMTSATGRTALNALMSVAAGTPQAMARAAQVQAILKAIP